MEAHVTKRKTTLSLWRLRRIELSEAQQMRGVSEIHWERPRPAHISLGHRIRTSTRFGYPMQTPRPDHFSYPHGYPADKARQGEIVLRKPWMRAVFVAGLVGAFTLGLALTLGG
jgi:hypothetical protein